MTAIWTRPTTLETLAELHVGTAVAHLGIEFLEVGDDYLKARVPVDVWFEADGGPYGGDDVIVLLPLQGVPLRPPPDRTPARPRGRPST